MPRGLYVLQMSAADYAALLERTVDRTRPPLRMDYPAEIKRGRAFADQAEQMARRWEQARSASTCPRRSRRSAPRSPPVGVQLSQPAAAPHCGE